MSAALVMAVSRDREHRFSKLPQSSITLIAEVGVENDAHAGPTVQHRSRVRADPAQPNLRQVHLMHAELFDEVREAGFTVAPGQLGENVTTAGLNLLDLPRGTRLGLGLHALVEITGLRNPCAQIEAFQPGLLAQLAFSAPDGSFVCKAGIMGVVVTGGIVSPGDPIVVQLPDPPWHPLDRV